MNFFLLTPHKINLISQAYRGSNTDAHVSPMLSGLCIGVKKCPLLQVPV